MAERLLIIDTCSNALDLAMRAQEYGHEVLYYDKNRSDGSHRMAGRGIVPKLIDFDLLRKKYIGWSTIIFCPDNVMYLDLLEPYRKLGYPIFAPSVEAADWELDRAKGQAAMKAAGIKTIPGVEFHDFAEASKFVQKHQTYTVCKPSGDANKVLSYVGDDAACLVYMLEDRWPKNEKYVHDAKEHGFILQEKKVGTEFAVTGIFGPGGWADCWFENVEFKKFMDGDLGPTTGEMGTAVIAVKQSKLADIALKPVTKQLEALDYVGYIDISGCIDDTGEFWPFEYTVRPGWPIHHNIAALMRGDPVKWMVDLLNGRNTMDVVFDTACISVVMTIPDFPVSKLTGREIIGIPVYHAGDREHVHLSGVMMEDIPTQVGDKVVRLPGYVTTDDYVLCVTGTGETITAARHSAYSAIRKIKLASNDPEYRLDIGKGRFVKQLPEIQRHGFAKGFRF
jgi:phosphoribosylamine--glycine ligase